jgi:hypothetical protein
VSASKATYLGRTATRADLVLTPSLQVKVPFVYDETLQVGAVPVSIPEVALDMDLGTVGVTPAGGSVNGGGSEATVGTCGDETAEEAAGEDATGEDASQDAQTTEDVPAVEDAAEDAAEDALVTADVPAPEDLPVDERVPLRPATPYAVSKIAQDYMGLQYYLSNRVETVRVRPFNHIGPRQRQGFVAPDFACQIAEIESGKRAPQVHVGDLDAEQHADARRGRGRRAHGRHVLRQPVVVDPVAGLVEGLRHQVVADPQLAQTQFDGSPDDVAGLALPIREARVRVVVGQPGEGSAHSILL